MKIFLCEHKDGVFLVDEELSMFAKPYFVTYPQRISLLKERFEPGLDNMNLLNTVKHEELQELVNKSMIRWKPMIQFKAMYSEEERYGFSEEYIAKANIPE